ncbi:putative acetyltransferase [Gordonia polyisoprenivorans NBRC 16320 = JCM 10675]|uniref:GNAT family N-acetyltransferase n=2 Tax=Gordonia polyisoprenivorans TaxID=84595 RepID=A0A846WPF3_9ACTN|nr:GNAT family N-acetyltransferase [Gordonia polyisoprenivorans]GAB24951.1 putative acetyltransferase [Gordonia polyisoprenivorans NBRC 16320 = JCM 10675]
MASPYAARRRRMSGIRSPTYCVAMTTISPCSADDHDDWLPLWDAYLRFYETDLDPEITAITFRRIVSGDGIHGAIARDDQRRAIGLVHWLAHPSTWSRTGYCYLEDLFVAPDSRGSGVGRALIDHVCDAARNAGLTKVYWLTQQHNATARRLYDAVATDTGFVHYEIDLDTH